MEIINIFLSGLDLCCMLWALVFPSLPCTSSLPFPDFCFPTVVCNNNLIGQTVLGINLRTTVWSGFASCGSKINTYHSCSVQRSRQSMIRATWKWRRELTHAGGKGSAWVWNKCDHTNLKPEIIIWNKHFTFSLFGWLPLTTQDGC